MPQPPLLPLLLLLLWFEVPRRAEFVREAFEFMGECTQATSSHGP
jgi:hypothetical protein